MITESQKRNVYAQQREDLKKQSLFCLAMLERSFSNGVYHSANGLAGFPLVLK